MAVNMDKETALMYCGGDEEFLKEMYEMYLDADKRTEIQDAYEKKNWADYAILVHALKSTSKSIGAVELSEHSLQLEMAAKGQDEAMILAHHDAVLQEYAEVLDWCTRNK